MIFSFIKEEKRSKCLVPEPIRVRAFFIDYFDIGQMFIEAKFQVFREVRSEASLEVFSHC